MPAGRDRVEDVAAIELSHRQQVQRGGEQAHPGGAADGVEEKLVERHVRAQQLCQQFHQGRVAKNNRSLCERAGDGLGIENADNQCGHGDCKADQRSGDADVEQRAPVDDGRLDANEGAHGADEGGRREEVGVGGVDAVDAAREVVAQLVRQQDSHQGEREGPAREQRERVFDHRAEEIKPGEEFSVGILILLEGAGQVGAHGERADDGQQEQEQG